ncbi:MAG: M16 family metallopeptidase [Candidatus Limisoma sp.]
MIEIVEHKLSNGLKVVFNRNRSSQLAVVNVAYAVGARNEQPGKTGLAHFLEHLMFTGTCDVPSYDELLQSAGGESNAWTNNDLTNYYDVLPVCNLEVALALEADRMCGLRLDDKSFESQKSVVVEEFKQRYLNVPYGDQEHLLRDLAYKVHPYRWPTIGRTVDDVMAITKDDVKYYYDNYYVPSGAVLSIVADGDADRVLSMVERHFGEIDKSGADKRPYSAEPEQQEARRLVVRQNVPYRRIVRAYHMGDRLCRDYAECDILSDVLSNGRSSRLYRNVLAKGDLVSAIDASITANHDAGILKIQASLLPGVDFDKVEAAIDGEIEQMLNDVTIDEIRKCINKYESNALFSNLTIEERASNMAQCCILGDVDMINTEIDNYHAVTCRSFVESARKLLRPTNCSTLYYDIM